MIALPKGEGFSLLAFGIPDYEFYLIDTHFDLVIRCQKPFFSFPAILVGCPRKGLTQPVKRTVFPNKTARFDLVRISNREGPVKVHKRMLYLHAATRKRPFSQFVWWGCS
jgi:hypothetical protein